MFSTTTCKGDAAEHGQETHIYVLSCPLLLFLSTGTARGKPILTNQDLFDLLAANMLGVTDWATLIELVCIVYFS